MRSTLKRLDRSELGRWLTAAGLVAAGFAARKFVTRSVRPPVQFRDAVVLITGGSRGLGFALANELGARGALVALCARDRDELLTARDKLASRNIQVAVFEADITKQADIDSMVQRVIDRFGRIDVLVNDAGKISVGPADSFTHADYEDAMDLMFWGPVNMTFAVLPHLKTQGHGHIVNITSVGGRVSVPHLLPYSCAKFAFVGFSTGLSAELKTHDIDVLTVVPGLMRTGSYLNAEFKGSSREEFTWFALLGNLPGFSVAADYAAEQIVEAVRKRRHVCTISLPAKILIAAEALMPEATRELMAATNRYLLPGSASKEPHLGKYVNQTLNAIFQGATTLGRSAASTLNE
jgi:short-subunit dehydrogenase